ncbi:hypothetical protein A2303_03265 [Candidatus Falkowbacteria bacterium RIFOXYB2_FULL_47_14]|uniref:Uncharacterized protein n=1 Tax=Candidatus Falkowbacteria bacterium RIFOXYA2_FULL_47_19 TaxID=1797994 RepID=A0A1F5SLG1_9BACT|nr:MAG: hypothetical protein A2227_04360 [Candidatus Falkowbacteria bacterium RIFOXYA2_FULL_47_19]OGF36992.1 MAG: hypothetical protein A2468_01300 [Candidatus Falkowbacteria bacterium RIFOXYC2_FULL_46_15]OGF44028.1 MAG: hypothetical protein A2303_03265 [Candidatus Falkowbacteria bacterium RIFOXYB2_FULL_47_14]
MIFKFFYIRLKTIFIYNVAKIHHLTRDIWLRLSININNYLLNYMDQLNDKEKKELELLDNPEVKYLTPSTGIVPYLLTDRNRRKDRVVELRTKQKMAEEGLDENKDWQKYYKIKSAEEKRFDERFKS